MQNDFSPNKLLRDCCCSFIAGLAEFSLYKADKFEEASQNLHNFFISDHFLGSPLKNAYVPQSLKRFVESGTETMALVISLAIKRRFLEQQSMHETEIKNKVNAA